ncbi:MAG: GNAT family N-acetyltransferase [Acidobacteriia bacterium]|nr:GNAT family N-acetyltransferase [Terriglobia bacterium]
MIQDAGALSSRITLRPVAVADDAFLYSVYASTRAEEMTRVPWTPEQKEAFLRMQFTAQKQHYAAEFPHAQHDLILLDDSPVGRLYLARNADALHILDITVSPERRNTGIGSAMLGRIQNDASSKALPVTIYVENFNPSLRLFFRLGFQPAEEKGFHYLMKWTRGQPSLAP